MAAKYRQLFLQMIEDNRDLFLDFKEIHDKFVKDPDTFKEQFNEKGKVVVEIIRDNELKLTAQQNRGQYSKFSSNLSDKFWDQIRGFLPQIDFVGVK